MRHPEVAVQVLLGVASALMPDDHHRLAIEARPSTDDRGVLAKETVAVELDEVGEAQTDVIIRQGALEAPRHLHALERREVLVDLLAKVGQLTLQRRDL